MLSAGLALYLEQWAGEEKKTSQGPISRWGLFVFFFITISNFKSRIIFSTSSSVSLD